MWTYAQMKGNSKEELLLNHMKNMVKMDIKN